MVTLAELKKCRVVSAIRCSACSVSPWVLAMAFRISAQLVFQTEIDQCARGLALDRGIALVDSLFQLPLEFGNPLLEIGHGVLGKRGHSRKIHTPGRSPGLKAG
jgi:hypothetical protein